MRKVIIFLCLFLIIGCTKIENENSSNNINDNQLDKIEVNKKINKSDEIEKIVNEMSLEEKIGQMLFVRLNASVNDVIKEYHVGGFIMFGVDFKNKTKEQVISEIKEYQNISKIPLLMGVDEEGGTVVRISSNPNLYKERFKSPQEVYKLKGMEGIIEDTENKANLLKELGLNVNLAPVADVSTDSNDFIYDRSFGDSADKTKDYIKEVVKVYNENKVGSCLKHFPGYGNNVDTHTGIAIDNRDYNTFLESDFIPFKGGIEEGVPSILVSHNIVVSMDDKPASLSLKVHEVLRNDLGFKGVIMTDDLDMGAIREYSDNPYIDAVLAGNDLLVTTDYKKTYETILKGVKNGEIEEEIINEAVYRILKLKYDLGIIKEG